MAIRFVRQRKIRELSEQQIANAFTNVNHDSIAQSMYCEDVPRSVISKPSQFSTIQSKQARHKIAAFLNIQEDDPVPIVVCRSF